MIDVKEIESILRDLRTGFYGWGDSSALRNLVSCWSKAIGMLEGPEEAATQSVRFNTFISSMRLRGLGEVPLLVLGEDSAEVRRAIVDLLNRTASGRILAVVLCVADSSFRYVRSTSLIPPGRFVVLSRDDIRAVLAWPSPMDRLKRFIHTQIPLRKLIPFSISEPAEGLMFVGREHELGMLVDEDNQDFALCGPGGMGKTSLLRQTIWLLRRQRNPRFERVVEVGLISCKPNLDAAAQEIARRISSTKFASELTYHELEPFLRRIKSMDARFQTGPIDLFIDEMDSILMIDRLAGETPQSRYPLMRTLRHARHAGLIRLTISGRVETKRLLDDPDNPFVVDGAVGHARLSRLKLVTLSPLDDYESEVLLLESLRDLGLDVLKYRDQLIERLRGCRGVPVAIQNLGLDLANAAIAGRDGFSFSNGPGETSI